MQPTDPSEDVASLEFEPSLQVTKGQASSWKLGGEAAALLVGEHSVGSDGFAQNRFVAAPLVDIQDGGVLKGRYSWWVGDEGAKADLGKIASIPLGTNVAENLVARKMSPNLGFPTLGNDWTSWTVGSAQSPLSDASSRVLSRQQAALVDPAIEDQVTKGFHDFTTYSGGILSNSRVGGVKKDLSIAFEIPEAEFRRTEFAQVLSGGEVDPDVAFATDHGSRITGASPLSGKSTKTAVNFRDSSWAQSNTFRGPTFDLLRDHYQLYRQVSNPFSPNAAIAGRALSPNVPDTSGNNIRGRAAVGDYYRYPNTKYFESKSDYEVSDSYSGKMRIRPMTTELLPELIRITYTISYQAFREGSEPSSPYKLRVFMTPFFVLHNPYNVTLNSPAMWVRLKRIELRTTIKVTDPAGTVKTLGNLDYQRLIESKFGDDASLETNEQAQDALDFFLSGNGSPSAPINMAPGETKLFTMTGSQPTDGVSLFTGQINRSMFLEPIPTGGGADLFKTGVYLRQPAGYKKPDVEIEPNSKVQFLVTSDPKGVGASVNTPSLAFNANEMMEVVVKAVPAGLGNTVPLGANNSWPQVKATHLFSSSHLTGTTSLTQSPLIPIEDLAAPISGKKTYIGKLDYYLKAAKDPYHNDNNFSLTTHNPRALVQSPHMSGAQGPTSTRIPATWSGSIQGLSSSSPGFEERFWGTSTNTAGGGQQFVTVFDVPRTPLTSLAQLQHANSSRLGVAPAYPIGNSYASPYVAADNLFWRSSANGQTDYWIIDHSYTYNRSLFDDYFFSGVNPGRSGQGWNNQIQSSTVRLGSDPTTLAPLQSSIDNWVDGVEPLLNESYQFSSSSNPSPQGVEDDLDLEGKYSSNQTSLTTSSNLRPHNTISAYILNRGSFNINSTSEKAWRTQLASVRDVTVDSYDIGGGSFSSHSGDGKTPVPGIDIPGGGSATGSDELLWNGFRSLSDSQIDELAGAIVAEIKSRVRSGPAGTTSRPFTTVGEFVNRKIASSIDPASRSGVLQTAIDQTLNTDSVFPASSKQKASRVFQANRANATETQTIDYQNPSALAEMTLAGAPQWLMQADLLTELGPRISARSDTFLVRAYGESVDGNGKVKARAWLEATIQRSPQFVDSSDHAALPVSNIKLTNQIFGRRFKIISFKWLRPDEV